MKLTAYLALNQVKMNKKRSIGAVMAITLSTALITALMCLVSSGNKMLTTFLGEGYGDYGGMYRQILIVPILLLTLFVFFMSFTVISNIFEASANKRNSEFGILKCVGGTEKQIRETIIYEGLWLSLIGIPLGLLIGTGIGFIAVTVIGHYISQINDFSKSIIMRPMNLHLSFSLSVWTYVIALMISYLMVLVSSGKPAKKVSQYTALNFVKGIETTVALREVKGLDKLYSVIGGTEGEIAIININRNKSGFKAMIKALAMGMSLLILTAGLMMQANEFEIWMTPDSDEMMVDFTSICDYLVDDSTGKEEELIRVPITSGVYNEITQRLSDYGDLKVYGIGSDACTFDAVINEEYLTSQMQNASGIYNEFGEMETSLLAVDEKLYKELCDRAKAPYGSNLIINSFKYNSNGEMLALTPFSENLTKVSLVNAHDEELVLDIGGFLYEDDLIESGFEEPFPNPVRIVVPNIGVRYFDWYCKVDDETKYAEYARNILNDYYPLLTEDSYVDQGYTVRISRMDSMVKVLNIAIVIVEFIMYGFVLLLSLMGITAVISTIATNIRVRTREFAVFKSIGMTNKSVRKMIYIESIICMVKAFVPGIVIGIAIPFCINIFIRKVFPVTYHIPWVVVIVGLLLITMIVMVITCIEIYKMKNKSIIEEIRMNVW